MGMSKQEELKKLIDCKLIKKRVNELANEISDFYKDQNFLAIGVLKGSLFFLSDSFPHSSLLSCFNKLRTKSNFI